MLYFHCGYWTHDTCLDSEDFDCRAIIVRGAKILIVSFNYGLATHVPRHIVFADAEYALKWRYASAHLATLCAVRARNRYPNICLMGQVLIVPTLLAWPDAQLSETWKGALARWRCMPSTRTRRS